MDKVSEPQGTKEEKMKEETNGERNGEGNETKEEINEGGEEAIRPIELNKEQMSTESGLLSEEVEEEEQEEVFAEEDHSEFTDEEWNKIVGTPFIIYYLTSTADGGAIAAAREFAAYEEVIADSITKYRDNKLIQGAFWYTDSDEKRREMKEKTHQGDRDFDSFKDNLMQEIMKTLDIVDKKSPVEKAREYRKFLFELAERVAQASGEGFMGLGKKISDKEASFLAELKVVLDL